MDANTCKVMFHDGRIRLTDGKVEQELMLNQDHDFILSVGLVCAVCAHAMPEEPIFLDSAPAPLNQIALSQPEYSYCYLVASGDEIREGATVFWQDMPVLQFVAGELVNLVKFNRACDIYGGDMGAGGLYVATADLYHRIACCDSAVKSLESQEEQDTRIAEMLGVTESFLRSALDYEATLGGEPSKPEEEEL